MLQVLTTKQLAEMMVHCYPYMPSMEPFIHNLAAETGYPIKEDVVAAAQTNHMTTEWRQFSEYAKYAATEIFHEHVPFLKCRPGALAGMRRCHLKSCQLTGHNMSCYEHV